MLNAEWLFVPVRPRLGSQPISQNLSDPGADAVFDERTGQVLVRAHAGENARVFGPYNRAMSGVLNFQCRPSNAPSTNHMFLESAPKLHDRRVQGVRNRLPWVRFFK